MTTVSLTRLDSVAVGVWCLLGVALIVMSVREYLVWRAAGSVVARSVVGLVSILTGLFIARARTLGRWLGGIGGAVLLVYAIALVLLGSEDVGGLGVSLPASLLIGGFGLWNVAAAGRK